MFIDDTTPPEIARLCGPFLGEVDHLLDRAGRIFEDVLTGRRLQMAGELRQQPDTHPLFCAAGLFDPMGKQRSEVAYTKALAWFMDPNNPHECGDEALAALLPLLAGEATLDFSARCSIRAEDSAGCGRFDIVVSDDGARAPFTVIIEAKVDSEVDPKQLRRYEAWARKRFPSARRVLFVLLTLGGPAGIDLPAHCAAWRHLTFKQVAETLQPLCIGVPSRHLLRLFIASIWKDIYEVPTGELLKFKNRKPKENATDLATLLRNPFIAVAP